MRQMPTEGRRFKTVDSMWRKNMEQTVDDPNFMRCCDRDKLLEKFKEANQKLDEIQKGLNDYLETKRISFPRFFFLSNDELLEILSQTKDPLLVQPHLGKAFEGLNEVKFESDLKISNMISPEKEMVPLNVPIDPESPKNKGNVEMWMLDIEAEMRACLKDFCTKALERYPTMVRTEWMR